MIIQHSSACQNILRLFYYEILESPKQCYCKALAFKGAKIGIFEGCGFDNFSEFFRLKKAR